MKIYRTSLFLIPTLVLIAACNKEDTMFSPWEDYDGVVSVDLNGLEMEDIFTYGNDVPIDSTKGRPGIGIGIVQYEVSQSFGSLRRILGFTQIPRKKGVHKLFPHNDIGIPFSSHSTAQDDGDVGADYYDLNLEYDNYFEVIHISEDGILSGTFQVSFIRQNLDEPPKNRYGLDTVYFTNGYVQTKLKKPE